MPWPLILKIMASVPEIVKDLVTVVTGVGSLIQLWAMLIRDKKTVQQAIPGEKPSLINMVQNSANKTVLQDKTMLAGVAPITPMTPTAVVQDSELKQIIERNTVAPIPAPPIPHGTQTHVSLIDGKVTY